MFKDFKGAHCLGNANVVLIHKKENKNYRPISLLSVVYKVFTKIIVNRVTSRPRLSTTQGNGGV